MVYAGDTYGWLYVHQEGRTSCLVNSSDTSSNAFLRLELTNTFLRALPLPFQNPIHNPPPHLLHLLLPLSRLSLQPFQKFGFTPTIPSPFDCCGPVTPFVVFPG